MMALAAILIAFTLTIHLQISFGQLNLGNNFSLESNTLATLQQQAQKTNTESKITVENVDNKSDGQFVTGVDVDKPHENKTTAYFNGNTVSNIKYLRNQAYNVPVSSSSLTMINNKGLALQPTYGNHFHPTLSPSFINFVPIGDQLNTTAQRPIKRPDINSNSSKSPLFITFGSPPQTSSSFQPAFLSNIPPMLSSALILPDAVKLQTNASPPQKQVSHQTFTSFHIQPANVQNQGNLRFAQMPSAVASPQTTSTPDKTIQSRHSLTSLLLPHLLSQSSSVEDPSTPIVNHYPNRNLKPSNLETLLPLLLHLLNERNNDCCKCRKCHRYNNCKKFDVNSLEIESDTKERLLPSCKADKCEKPSQDTVEEEYYSDEISDYSAEYYDDD